MLTPDFVFPVYRDEDLVRRLIIDLKRLYPASRLVCVADSPFPDLNFVRFAEQNQVIFLPGKRLKLPEFGGLWLERLLSHALQYCTGADIIRTEGDARFWRQFRSRPEAEIAGTLNYRYGYDFPRGGCVYLRRTAIVKILASGILRHDRYRDNPRYQYYRYSRQFCYADERLDLRPILLADLILGDVIQRLNLSLSDWSDVSIQFRDRPPDNSDLKFAVTHPHHP